MIALTGKRTKQLVIFTIVLIGFSFSAFGQECGPGCPVCSGSGQSTGALIPPGSLLTSFLLIPGGEEETGVTNLRAGIFSWLDLGFGYTVKTKKPIWSIRLQPITEDESSLKPSLILGTGSVQTGQNDQSLFLISTKAYEFSEIFSARLSLGAAGLLPGLDKAYFLSSLTLTITERWSPFVSYDGRNFHYGLSFIPYDWLYLGVLMLEAKTPSFLIGTRLILSKNE